MDYKEISTILFGKELSLEEMLRLTSFYREGGEPDYSDPYMVDRWFDNEGRFQTQAAIDMGVAIQPNRTKAEMPTLPPYDGVVILPACTEDLAVGPNRWNWPRLIARAERLTGRKLSKASVDRAKRKQGYNLPKPGLNEFITGTVQDFYKRNLAKLWPEKENFASGTNPWSISRLVKLGTAPEKGLLLLADYLMEFEVDAEEGGIWTKPSEEALNNVPDLYGTYKVIRPDRYIPSTSLSDKVIKDIKAALVRLSPRHKTNGEYNYLLIALEINNQFGYCPPKSELQSWLE